MPGNLIKLFYQMLGIKTNVISNVQGVSYLGCSLGVKLLAPVGQVHSVLVTGSRMHDAERFQDYFFWRSITNECFHTESPFI